MKTRNPNARCGNCPYWHKITEYGECRFNAPSAYTFESGEVDFHLSTHEVHWCGEHPDFWLEETDLSAVTRAHPDLPDLEHPDPNKAKIQEAVRLLNDGEHFEALKVFWDIHRLAARFVCDECGFISNHAGGTFGDAYRCDRCGGRATARIVHDPGGLAMQVLAETDGRKDDEE